MSNELMRESSARSQPVQQSTRPTDAGQRSGRAVQLRQMSFAEGEAALSPPPVQMEGGATAAAEAATAAPTTAAPTTAAPTTAAPTTAAPATEAPTVAPAAEAAPASPLADPTRVLSDDELTKLSYADVTTYLDTRAQSVVTALRTSSKFIAHCESFGVPSFASIVARLLLVTPGAVVDRAGARTEALRILASQLQDADIAKRLLSNGAQVVIVPRTMLMTDLPEFAAQRSTYTFDGRPWDTVRGLGGKNTAIAEENLTGTDVSADPSMSRDGWANQQAMEAANKAGRATPSAAEAVVNNPGVYCAGYSTTNHEFFHTIHMYGLTARDNGKIQAAYDAKKGEPRATQWADGPRQLADGSDSENYASSTVYEYFAQTGCAFQGTNTGTDPYTSLPRNNGRSWVTTNEPVLSEVLGRVCSSSELRDVNPRGRASGPASAGGAVAGSAAAATASAAPAATGAATAAAATAGATPAPKTTPDEAALPTPVGSSAVGFIANI
jgi:hypothetical protein